MSKSPHNDLFDENLQPPANQTLIIQKGSKKTLSKNEKKFNSLLKQVEKLENKIQLDTRLLDGHLVFYHDYFQPIWKEQTNSFKIVIRAFYPFYVQQRKSRTFLTKAEIKLLHDLISMQLENLLDAIEDIKEVDDDLQKIYQDIKGKSFDQFKSESFNTVKEEISDFFQDSGFDLDLNDLKENMSEEETAIYMKKMQDELKSKLGHSQSKSNESKTTKNKTKKQLDREALESQINEAKAKNINTIYKQLAKLIHPDLEPDETLKKEKEEAMQAVIQAYQDKDLPALLRFELTWIKKEKIFASHSDENLVVYHELLKEQIQRLESERQLLRIHPRYHCLQRFIEDDQDVQDFDLTLLRSETIENIRVLQDSLVKLQGEQPYRILKEILHERKEIQRREALQRERMPIQDFFDDFFKNF